MPAGTAPDRTTGTVISFHILSFQPVRTNTLIFLSSLCRERVCGGDVRRTHKILTFIFIIIFFDKLNRIEAAEQDLCMYTVCERFLPALAMRRDEEIILLCPTVLFLSSPHTAAKNCYLHQPTRTAAKNDTYIHAHCCKKWYLHPRSLLHKMVLTNQIKSNQNLYLPFHLTYTVMHDI